MTDDDTKGFAANVLAQIREQLMPSDGSAEFMRIDDAKVVAKCSYREGWAFAYRQWQRTGSVPDPFHPSITGETK